ncbi:MAG: DegV family protein [Bacilli bacterium]|nr:DegV family protein [Bacilli bacterium]
MYTLFTDTDTDITLVEAKKYGYKLISMPYIVNDEEIKPYEDFEEFDYKTFYDTLRKGALPTTCAINSEKYKEYFKEELSKGNDVLYVHFSKAMSGTFNALNIAIEELKEEYPERTIYTIDTKGITILSLNIVKEIGEMYLSGASVEEILKWAEINVDHYATYFFADNLKFFGRSGRVSNVTAKMGNLIGIKPIIYMNDEGMMTNIGKERGRTSATNKLIEHFDELVCDPFNHRIIIGHTDALHLAEKLGNLLQEKYDNKLNIEYVVVNPTAGSHCGPDTVGISFYAKHK